MGIRSARLGLLLAFAALDGAIAVKARLSPGPYYVGQAVEVAVEAGGRPVIAPPSVAGADLHALPTTGVGPARFIMVPRRPGAIDIPPFRSGSGGSKPIRLAVQGIPAAGRGRGFLGGVGRFDLAAEAEPTSLRAGGTLDYRIRVKGPAAWGSRRGPDLSGWASTLPGLRVEPMPETREAADPASVTYRYRLRPTRSGRIVLPPVAVAAFDPSSRGFTTRVTAGVPITVEEPPRFDPSQLDDGLQPPGEPDRRSSLLPGLIVLGVMSMAIVAAVGIAWSRSWQRARLDPRRLAVELADGLRDDRPDPPIPRRITDALATFLARVDRRSPGVLTPPEAAEAFGRLTGDPELADRAGMLVARCDRSLYGIPGTDPMGLIDEAAGLLRAAGAGVGRIERLNRQDAMIAKGKQEKK